VLGALQPVDEDLPEAAVDDLGRGLEPRGEGLHGPLIGGEEQPGLAAEVLEDRALRDPELRSDLLHLRTLVAVLGERAHRRLDDPLPLGRGPRAGL